VGRPEVADLLRKHGGKTGAELEAAGKPVEPVAEAVKSESTTVKAPDISIHDAAYKGNIEVVKQHLAAGTDVNMKDKRGMTPLHPAVGGNHPKIVELLIAKGADVNTVVSGIQHKGRTPLDIATNPDNPNASAELANLLRKHGGKRGAELEAEGKPTESVAEATQPEPPTAKTPDASLWKATLFGEIEPAKQAIADGADVNAKDEDTGDTPLHRAVVAALDSGRNEVVELLIANGADVNAMGGTFGGTPLDITKRLSEAATLTKRLRELQGKTDDISVADLLRKHGGKTKKELEAEGK
jgi:ankyrin repeat protein